MTNQRKKAQSEDEAKVLTDSRRRCALCVYLNDDWDEKKGQLAHVDRNRSNSNINNLAYLCLDHHNEYDSKSNRTKGFTPLELKTYRDTLYKMIKTQPEILRGKESRLPRSKNSRTSLEIYDRRIVVYRTSRDFILKIFHHGTADIEDIGKFVRETEEALFLFDETVANHLVDMQKKAAWLESINSMLDAKAPGEDRTSLIKQKWEIFNWFTGQIDALRHKMRPFLML